MILTVFEFIELAKLVLVISLFLKRNSSMTLFKGKSSERKLRSRLSDRFKVLSCASLAKIIAGKVRISLDDKFRCTSCGTSSNTPGSINDMLLKTIVMFVILFKPSKQRWSSVVNFDRLTTRIWRFVKILFISNGKNKTRWSMIEKVDESKPIWFFNLEILVLGCMIVMLTALQSDPRMEHSISTGTIQSFMICSLISIEETFG